MRAEDQAHEYKSRYVQREHLYQFSILAKIIFLAIRDELIRKVCQQS